MASSAGCCPGWVFPGCWHAPKDAEAQPMGLRGSGQRALLCSAPAVPMSVCPSCCLPGSPAQGAAVPGTSLGKGPGRQTLRACAKQPEHGALPRASRGQQGLCAAPGAGRKNLKPFPWEPRGCQSPMQHLSPIPAELGHRATARRRKTSTVAAPECRSLASSFYLPEGVRSMP